MDSRILASTWTKSRILKSRGARETDGACGAPYLDCLGEEEQRNHDLALNGIFLETIDAVASTANTAVYAVLADSFH